MTHRFVFSLFAVALFLPLALRAADPPADPEAEERATWEQAVRDARAALAAAQERHAAADRAYRQMRHHHRGRGEKKAEILAEREAAAQELAEAQERLEALPEEARRAGVPPGWLQLDDEPAAPDP
jgi:hypothetical protein